MCYAIIVGHYHNLGNFVNLGKEGKRAISNEESIRHPSVALFLKVVYTVARPSQGHNKSKMP